MVDITLYRSVLEPVVTFFTAIVVGGVATTAAVQMLKLDFLGGIAKRYPRLTNLAVSLLASVVAVYNSSLELVIHGFWQTMAFAVGIFVVAAITYNNVVKTNESSATRL